MLILDISWVKWTQPRKFLELPLNGPENCGINLKCSSQTNLYGIFLENATLFSESTIPPWLLILFGRKHYHSLEINQRAVQSLYTSLPDESYQDMNLPQIVIKDFSKIIKINVHEFQSVLLIDEKVIMRNHQIHQNLLKYNIYQCH